MTKHLLQKFIDNSCSEEELEYVYFWLSAPENKEEISALMKISWDKMSDELPDHAKSKKSFIRKALQNRDNADSPPDFESTTSNNAKGTSRKWKSMKIAASIALAVSILFTVYYQINKDSAEVEEVIFIEKSNPIGRKSFLVLPDGSKVNLNSDSKIRYKKNFTVEYREVILEGEAFFEVKEDKERPFKIKTGDITTTVLGTTFNVNAYAKRKEISVAVVSGHVEVKKSAYYGNEESSTTYLIPNMMAVYRRDKRDLITTQFNIEEITGWKDGILIFKNADIFEIASKLKRWYGLDVEINNDPAMNSKRYTGKFDNNSLEYVLKAISYTSEIGFEIKEDNKVILIQK